MKQSTLVISMASILSTGGLSQAMAGDSPHSFSANISAVSNYMWRGVTQTNDGAAVQGGVDYKHASGFYAGTWISNIDWGTPNPNYELDLYAGYKGSFGEVGYDIKTIYYAYPDAEGDADFWELGASVSYSVGTLGLAYTLDGEVDAGPFNGGDVYWYGSLAFPLPSDFSIGATLGYYDFDDTGSEGDYTHWILSLAKDAGVYGTFSLNYDQNDGGENEIVAVDDDPKFWVGWTKKF